MIANFAAMDIRPGSMGRPLPGIEAAIVAIGTDGDGVDGHRGSRTSKGELALRPGWPSMFRGYLDERGALSQVLRGRLVSDRRPGTPGRRRLFLVRRPRRRRDQVGRPSDRPVRGRERADGASGGGRGRRDRQARSGRAARSSRLRARSRPAASPTRRCALELLGFARTRLGAGSGAARRSSSRRSLPQDAQRQDHAPPAAGARTRAAGRRHFDPGGDVTTRRDRAASAIGEPGFALLREMLRIRRFEEKCAELYSAGKDPRLPASL